MKAGHAMAVFFLVAEYIYIFSTFSERTLQKFIFVVVLGLCGLFCLIGQDIVDKKPKQIDLRKELNNSIRDVNTILKLSQ